MTANWDTKVGFNFNLTESFLEQRGIFALLVDMRKNNKAQSKKVFKNFDS